MFVNKSFYVYLFERVGNALRKTIIGAMHGKAK